MKLHDWALSERLITWEQYQEITKQIYFNTRGSLGYDADGLLLSNRIPVLQPTEFCRHPVGEVIDSMGPLSQQIYQKAGVPDLEGLVAKWQQWHVDNLEPLVSYATGTQYARRLYENRVEKKMAAWFLTKVPVRGLPIIWDTDRVVVPDGSSAFYVGLAIAAWLPVAPSEGKEGVSIISSNGPLFCEHLCNPAFSNGLKDFYVIGGKADRRQPHCQGAAAFKRCDNGGTFEDLAKNAYEETIMERPKATVVVMPVSGILPEEGPYGLEQQTQQLKNFIITCSLKKGVRELVFIADYSKHRKTDRPKYGLPVLDTPAEWRDLLADHHDQISLVTVPPPGMRKLFENAAPIHPAERRSIRNLKSDAELVTQWIEYNDMARRFGELFQDAEGRPRFHEVDSMSDKSAERASAVSEVASPTPRYSKSRRAPGVLPA